MITFASLLWDVNEHSQKFSLAYDESWAVKLFNGFRRHCRVPYRCVLYTDRRREIPANIEQVVQPDLGVNGYGDCIRPFEMNVPMVLVGLDTLIIGTIDKMAQWCLDNPGKLALPKHPYEDWSINGVTLWGGGNPAIFRDWRGENDMDWIRAFPHERIDDLWPGKVVSYRAHMRGKTLPKSPRIVYFHGELKPPDLLDKPLIRDNWK